jgi:hypothetical protein
MTMIRLFDPRCSPLLGIGLDSQERGGYCGQLISPNVALGKSIFRDHDRCHCIRPTRIEGEMKNDFGQRVGAYAIIERQLKVIRYLDSLVTRNQAATVTLLRSRADKPGRFHTSPRSFVSV